MIAPEAGSDVWADRQPVAAPWDGSRRLWSLWDMLRIYAEKYIQLGARIWEARQLFELRISIEVEGERIGDDPAEIDRRRQEALRDVFCKLTELCGNLDLPVSAAILAPKVDDPPKTAGELDIIVHAVVTEIESRLFLFVPQHAAKYYEFDDIVSDKVKDAFPNCSAEIRAAGTCFAAGVHTACVFHSMRAAEIGVRVFGNALQVELKHPIKLSEWGAIQGEIDKKISDIRNLPRTMERDADQRFYSEAAAQLRYFKDAWRVRVAHAREIFTEQQALTVMDHVREFFETISARLKE
jgi:hypothetical protein